MASGGTRKRRAAGGGAFVAVYRLVRRIPRGRVMTYGQISEWLDGPLSPAAVGWALAACPDDVPWQRVVNAAGGCSTDRDPSRPPGRQRALLEDEGVEFDADGTLSLERYRYRPRKTAGTEAPVSRRRTSRGRNGASRP